MNSNCLLMHARFRTNCSLSKSEICRDNGTFFPVLIVGSWFFCPSEQRRLAGFLAERSVCIVMSPPVILENFKFAINWIQLIYCWRTSVCQAKHKTLYWPPGGLNCSYYVLWLFYVKTFTDIGRVWFRKWSRDIYLKKWLLESFAKGRRHEEMQSLKKYST